MARRRMSVRKGPGLTSMTLTGVEAVSAAYVRTSASSAAFDTE